MGLLEILNQYAQRRYTPPPQVLEDFDRVSHEASAEDLEYGLEEAFNSDVTPPFEHMVGQLYDESDDDTRAGLIEQLRASLGSSDKGEFLRRSGRLPASEIEAAAAEAKRQNPGVIQTISRFYARNPQIVQVLGQAALGILMSGMARRRR